MTDFKSGEKVYTIYKAMNGWVLERGWDGGWVLALTGPAAVGIIADMICFEWEGAEANGDTGEKP